MERAERTELDLEHERLEAVKSKIKIYLMSQAFRNGSRGALSYDSSPIKKLIDEFLGDIGSDEKRRLYLNELNAYVDEMSSAAETTVAGRSAREAAGELSGRYSASRGAVRTSAARGTGDTGGARVSFSGGAQSVTLGGSDSIRSGYGGSVNMDDARGYSRAPANKPASSRGGGGLEDGIDDYIKKAPGKKYSQSAGARGQAEMNASFEKYLAEKKALLSKGVTVVCVSSHSNCSERCEPFQGKLYSLDGTSGEIDGKRYTPIEDAAEKRVATTRAGKKYYNGLFSYNCRHRMIPYEEGMVLEEIPKEVIAEQRALEKKQRAMERDIRHFREKIAIKEAAFKASGGTDLNLRKQISAMKKKAAGMRKDYENFSRENHVTIYGERLRQR